MVKRNLILLVLFLTFLALAIIFLFPENKEKIKTDHFTFIFSRSIDTSKINELARALESTYTRIGNDLKTIPSGNVGAVWIRPAMLFACLPLIANYGSCCAYQRLDLEG